MRIGDAANGCAGNRIAGDNRLSGYTGGLTLGTNSVSGNVTVDNNTVGTAVVTNNNVFRTLGCAGNSPAPVKRPGERRAGQDGSVQRALNLPEGLGLALSRADGLPTSSCSRGAAWEPTSVAGGP